MKRVICVFVFLCSASIVSAQKFQLPRNPERLIARAQEFWAAIVAGQRLKALELVVPEKKELFLGGNAMPVFEARVAAVDLTENVNRATVHVEIGVFVKEVASGRAKWNISDVWVWRGNNWYVDLADARDVMKVATGDETGIQEIQKRIEASLTLLQDSIDLGTVVQGDHIRKEIPIRYDGDLGLAVESLLAPELLGVLAPAPEGITARSKYFVLLVNTENWNGPFTVPLPVRFRREAAVVEKVLTVKGDVFVPLAFRQDPPLVPIREGELVSVFIRNNSDQAVRVRYMTVDAKFDVFKQPSTLEPNQESEVALRLRPDQVPDRLYVVLDAPFYGRENYSYRFRVER